MIYRILLCLLLAVPAAAQVGQTEVDGQTLVTLTPQSASVLEFWGQKGISSIELIYSLQTEVKLLENQIKLYELSNKNLMNAQTEYRDMASRSNEAVLKLQVDLNKQKQEAEEYKGKMLRQRKYLFAAAAVVAGVLYLNLSGK